MVFLRWLFLLILAEVLVVNAAWHQSYRVPLLQLMSVDLDNWGQMHTEAKAEEDFSKTVEGWGQAASGSSLVQVQSGPSSQAVVAEKTYMPSLWGIIWLEGLASGHKTAVILFSCVVVFIGFSITCLLHRTSGNGQAAKKIQWPTRMDTGWDAELEVEKSTAASDHSPCCSSDRSPCCSFSGPPLQVSYSDSQVSPRAESFASCQEEDCGDLITPRSLGSYADCEEDFLLRRPSSRTDCEVLGKEQEDGPTGIYGKASEARQVRLSYGSFC